MIEDWRYDDGKMNERSLAISAFVRKGIDLNRGVYEFCADFVSQGVVLSLLKEHCDGTGEIFTMEVQITLLIKLLSLITNGWRKRLEDYYCWWWHIVGCLLPL